MECGGEHNALVTVTKSESDASPRAFLITSFELFDGSLSVSAELPRAMDKKKA